MSEPSLVNWKLDESHEITVKLDPWDNGSHLTQEDLQIDWRVGADWFEVSIAVSAEGLAWKGLE